MSEAEIYQILLGFTGASTNSFKSYLAHVKEKSDPKEAAKEVERFLDQKMQDAQVTE